ncbi:unnamed protein product [Ceutorhynchus assimilis]|uniref:Annexin n=1 Tax=Ceutorhynchus assimilis TaxID=467358 RepID=A0A9P0DI50_9CUCU|nr:unnamed protein product [Ceutorhynchus assimilis]
MSYQSGQRPGAPSYPPQGYPQQTQGGAQPYPNSPAYPPLNPNSFGYNSGAPMQMPQPMPMPTYPPSAPAGYPSYPPQPSSGGYPPSASSGGYPPASGGGYPPASGGGYPPPSGGYPPASAGGYPPPSGGYPPASGGGYPPASSGSYPPQPSRGGYPPASSGGHPHAGGSPSHYHSAPGAPPGGQGYQGPTGPYGGVSYTHSTPSMQPARLKRTPTVVPMAGFNPRADAEVLRKAMKGFGTDEKAIINVLAHRTNQQRLQIAFEFKTLYGKDLVKDLKSETTGNFENVLVAMMTPLPEYYAQELHDAMAGAGTDEDVLIEIMCTKSNEEIMVIRQAYQKIYHRSLEQDLKGDTGGTFKRLMVSLCNACRDESMAVNPDAARADAQALLRAGELRLGTDESTFNAILCQRNWAHLQCVFQEYERLTGHDIEKAIKNEFSGEAEQGLLAVVRSIKNQAAYFAKCLNKSMKGLGTNDRDLIRLVVTRSEIDMVEIKREYQAKYGESLADAIKGDTSGHYKKCLLHLIGEQP